jgi:CRISPR type I-A-associated protein Csa5
MEREVEKGIEEKFEGIVNMLRFFSKIRRYSFLDRIGNALNYETVEFALWEAIRTFRSIYDSAKIDKKNGKELRYYEEEEKKIILPRIPDESQITEFLKLAKEDIGVARRLAIKALSFPYISKEEE